MNKATLTALMVPVVSLAVLVSICLYANRVQADEEYNWEAEGEVICTGTYLQTTIDWDLTYELGIYYIKDGFSLISWFDYCDRTGRRNTKHFYPYGPLTLHDEFRVIKLDDSHYRFENLTAKASGAYSTEDGAPDRSKQ